MWSSNWLAFNCTIANNFNDICEGNKAYSSLRVIFRHIFDLCENSLFNCVNPASAHTSGDINAIHDRDVFRHVLCRASTNLLLFLFFLIFNLRSRLDNVVDRVSFRFFFGVYLNEVFVTAKFAIPHLLFLFISGDLAVHIEVPLARFACNGVTCRELWRGFLQAAHWNLENISVHLLLKLFSLRHLTCRNHHLLLSIGYYPVAQLWRHSFLNFLICLLLLLLRCRLAFELVDNACKEPCLLLFRFSLLLNLIYLLIISWVWTRKIVLVR